MSMGHRVSADREPTIRRSMRRIRVLHLMLDVLAACLGAMLGLLIQFGHGNWRPDEVDHVTNIPAIDFGWIVIVWVVALWWADAYSTNHFARSLDEVRSVAIGTARGVAVCAIVAYLINYDMSRGYFCYAFVTGSLLMVGQRAVVAVFIRRMRANGQLLRRVLAVGGAHEVVDIGVAFAKEPALGYQLVAAATPSPHDIPGVAQESMACDLVELCQRHWADTLLIGGGAGLTSRDLRRLGWDLEETSIDLIVLPSLVDVTGPRIHVRPAAGLPFLHVEAPQWGRAVRWQKAGFDRVVAAVLVVLLSPLMLLIALAVRLDSPGRALFRHERVGMNGRSFSLWKFRSMQLDAHLHHDDLVAATGSGPLLFKHQDDPRVTRVGAVLRRYSLDELPQLFNVLKGDMSLVGPRPQVLAEVSQYEREHFRRLRVKPGMTGLWQVSGRNNLRWEDAVQLDLSYVDNWSMVGDLVIMCKTVGAVLRPQGAY